MKFLRVSAPETAISARLLSPFLQGMMRVCLPSFAPQFLGSDIGKTTPSSPLPIFE
jgi:hypothetical protein